MRRRRKGTPAKHKECLRNPAASIGGNAFDGCGEFVPGGEEGTIEALKDAAPDCHRNFHRNEVDGETQFGPSSRRNPLVLQMPPPPPCVLSKKRFRTKLTQEQKDKMMEFAERIGWRKRRWSSINEKMNLQ
ncbi:zinc-finger homeodomain protein 5-like [Manihot esculenta]|uniref:zinc-finger homeodomain protein 5-like n=1 Tax=Manihot esculenta TaxID=3983 RepID=UPI000B5D8B90|nr:zinc-finger homeodomain protein 5-like [Manihot esculenta]